MSNAEQEPAVRVRRPPPPFRRATVRRTEELTSRLVRVTLAGDELDGLSVDEPAASVRLLLPSPDRDEFVVPEWTGNEFLLPDGERPVIRTLTPRRVDSSALELDVDIVIHDGGNASTWAATAEPGDPAAVSGPARGYTVDDDASAFLLAGDETAIPAISQLVESLPTDATVDVHIEIAGPDARLPLPDHPQLDVQWHELPTGSTPGDVLVPAVQHAELPPGTRVWAAGEAAAMQRIRGYLFEDLAYPRRHATIRGYWKYGRNAGNDA